MDLQIDKRFFPRPSGRLCDRPNRRLPLKSVANLELSTANGSGVWFDSAIRLPRQRRPGGRRYAGPHDVKVKTRRAPGDAAGEL